jgi:hypothetical protein
MIRVRNLAIGRVRGARGDRAEPEGGPAGATVIERFDPEGSKNPEGEWRLRVSRQSEAGNRQRAQAKKRPGRGKPNQPWSGKPNGLGNGVVGSEVAGRKH